MNKARLVMFDGHVRICVDIVVENTPYVPVLHLLGRRFCIAGEINGITEYQEMVG